MLRFSRFFVAVCIISAVPWFHGSIELKRRGWGEVHFCSSTVWNYPYFSSFFALHKASLFLWCCYMFCCNFTPAHDSRVIITYLSLCFASVSFVVRAFLLVKFLLYHGCGMATVDTLLDPIGTPKLSTVGWKCSWDLWLHNWTVLQRYGEPERRQ